jgi:hypothetical protein
MGRYYPNAKEIVENTTKLGIFKGTSKNCFCNENERNFRQRGPGQKSPQA